MSFIYISFDVQFSVTKKWVTTSQSMVIEKELIEFQYVNFSIIGN